MIELLFSMVVAITIGLLAGFLYFQNKGIVTKRYRLSFLELPEVFDHFTIAHLSDLHNCRFGKGQRALVRAVKHVHPDAICITGDLVDERFYDEGPVIELVHKLVDIAPIYYVSGNHEWHSGHDMNALFGRLAELGVTVLSDRAATIERSGKRITFAGIDDYSKHGVLANPVGAMEDALKKARHEVPDGSFPILLVHRPEWIDVYALFEFKVILSGHAHGGQWKLPWFGPVYAPGQGMFPHLVSGIHHRKGSTMIISRGIGNSGMAFQRLFNRPEVVSVTLRKY